MKRLLAALIICALITRAVYRARSKHLHSKPEDPRPQHCRVSCADLDPYLSALSALAVDLGGDNWQPFVLPLATMSDTYFRAMSSDDWRTYSRIYQDYANGLRAIEPPPLAATGTRRV